MASIMYMVSILLSLTAVLMIPGGIALAAYAAFFMGRNITLIIAGAVVSVLGLALNVPLQNMRIKYREKVEYDEFGRSKSKGSYQRLSKKERDMIDLQTTADMERIVSSSELMKLTHKGSNNPEADLNRLIGLETVKQKMREMAARMAFDSENGRGKRGKRGKPSADSISSRHMVFFGSPGTGKTTVARILTGYLYNYGYIGKNKCVEIDGNFLKAGEYTAQKTEYVIRQAYDGVLFIDEAYVLASGYGSDEAIATLIKQMEDSRGRFILIMAGYTNEMRHLLQANPGFSSRIREYLDFPDYTQKEMDQIFSLMASQQGFSVSPEAMHSFEERISKERRLESFGNARTARNVLDESIDRHALNIMNGTVPKNSRFLLCGPDVSPELKRRGI